MSRFVDLSVARQDSARLFASMSFLEACCAILSYEIFVLESSGESGSQCTDTPVI